MISVKYLGQRVLLAILTVFVIVTLTFLLTHTLPGDPVSALVGDYPAPPEYVQKVTEDFGLNDSLWRQLWLYYMHALQGDFGFSFANRQEVLPLIIERGGRSLLLMIPGLIMASFLGIWIGRVSAPRRGSFIDQLLTWVSLVGYSAPVFWIGQLLLLLFAVRLGWLPVQGMHSVGDDSLWDLFRHWLLPTFSIVIYFMAIVARVARSSFTEALGQPFMLTAAAKGLRRRVAVRKHAVRNGMIPVATVIGYNFSFAIVGAILTETVFGWPGMGTLFMQAITQRDYPVLEGIFVVSSISVVVVNFLTDLVYMWIDPRIESL